MTLEQSSKAIGKVTEWLRIRLEDRTGINVSVGRPEPTANGNGDSQEHFNLFLYEAVFDPSLKNTPLDEGRPPPLWLVLKYLLTSFDEGGSSDTVDAHENLGSALQALQELGYLPIPGPLSPETDIRDALQDNPEVLKITFDEAPTSLLSQIMQGTDEKYRFSMAFQLRPVLVAPEELPSYSLLVGVDYTQAPPKMIGEEGVEIPVLPSLGPVISRVQQAKFEAEDTLRIYGTDLNLSGLSVRLGEVELGVTAQQPNWLEAKVDGNIPDGTVISAGSHPVSVVQTVLGGRKRSSNLLVGSLLPVLNSATKTLHIVDGPPNPTVAGDIEMKGVLLGREADDIFTALYQGGSVKAVFDATYTYTPDQKTLTLTISDDDAVPEGTYRLILRVNGQQAKNSPEVALTP